MKKENVKNNQKARNYTSEETKNKTVHELLS